MLLFMDGFDSYTTVLDKWDSSYGFSTSNAASRNSTGSGAAIRDALDHTCFCLKNLGSDNSTVIIGAAVYPETNYPSTPVFTVRDNGTLQETVSYTYPGGFVSIGSQVSTVGVPTNAWSYLEAEFVFGGAGTGTVVVRLNNIPILSVSGLSMGVSGRYSANQIELGPLGNYDDVYVCNATGTSNNSFLGDVHVSTQLPTGAGTYTQLTPVGESNNWQAVSQNPPTYEATSSDTIYVTGMTVGSIDTYQLSTLPVVGTVLGVQVSSYIKKQTSGTCLVDNVVLSGGTETDCGSFSPGTNYRFNSDIFDNNPTTSAPWTYSDINTLQIGVKIAG
jgi:hypothetical protein